MWYMFIYLLEKCLLVDIELVCEDFMMMVVIFDKYFEGCEFIVGDLLMVVDCVMVYLIDWVSECYLIELFL